MKLNKIKISTAFSNNFPKYEKLLQCHEFYKKHGYLDRQIVVNKNNVLIDGYVGYIILRAQGVNRYPVVINTQTTKGVRND